MDDVGGAEFGAALLESERKMKHVDVIVVGGGLVGATLAAMLCKTTHLRIALVEPKPPMLASSATSHRVSAVAMSSIAMFKHIGAFDAMQASGLSPYTAMHVWDGGSAGELHFEAGDVAASTLGYIIFNDVMLRAVQSTFSQHAALSVFQPATPHSFKRTDDGVVLTLASGEILHAQVAVAADGAASWLREQVGITVTPRNDHETAIVATVTTEKPHQQTAQQIFLKTGPLAFLPLSEPHTSSIVWSMPAELAVEKMALTDDVFARHLALAFEHRLGNVTTVTERHSHALLPQQATHYIKKGVALVGDAAHTMHPLAGQGVNLGLLDAASLVDVFKAAIAANQPLGEVSVLRRYERWRFAENQPMLLGVDGIKRIFLNQHPWFGVLRGQGLSMIDRLPLIKSAFARYAVGQRQGLPSLASLNLSA